MENKQTSLDYRKLNRIAFWSTFFCVALVLWFLWWVIGLPWEMLESERIIVPDKTNEPQKSEIIWPLEDNPKG